MSPNENDALIPCPHCQQHHCVEDAQCPHCGAALKPGEKTPGDTSYEMRVMYGPAMFDNEESQQREMYGPAPFQEEKPAVRREFHRVMYGPSPYAVVVPGPSLMKRVLFLLALCGLAALVYLLWSWVV